MPSKICLEPFTEELPRDVMRVRAAPHHLCRPIIEKRLCGPLMDVHDARAVGYACC